MYYKRVMREDMTHFFMSQGMGLKQKPGRATYCRVNFEVPIFLYSSFECRIFNRCYTSDLIQCLFLEIQEMVQKYDLIYQRVDLLRMENAVLTGSYKLSPFWVKSEINGFPFNLRWTVSAFIGSKV